MRGLRKDQELVEGIYTEATDQFQSNGQTHAAQIVHRFVERQASRLSQRAVCSPELVLDNITGITQQDAPRFLLPFDHVAHHVDQLIEQVLLRPAERRLIGNLEEVPDDLRPLTIQASVREPHLLKASQHPPNFLRQHQPRQMYEYRGTHAGSHIRRTGREKTELRVIRKGDPCTKLAVNPIERRVGRTKLETGLQRLHAEVILLIDHDAQAVRQVHGGAATQRMLRLESRELLADEMTLEQNGPVRGTELVHAHHEAFRHGRNLLQRLAHLRENAQALAIARSAGAGLESWDLIRALPFR